MLYWGRQARGAPRARWSALGLGCAPHAQLPRVHAMPSPTPPCMRMEDGPRELSPVRTRRRRLLAMCGAGFAGRHAGAHSVVEDGEAASLDGLARRRAGAVRPRRRVERRVEDEARRAGHGAVEGVEEERLVDRLPRVVVPFVPLGVRHRVVLAHLGARLMHERVGPDAVLVDGARIEQRERPLLDRVRAHRAPHVDDRPALLQRARRHQPARLEVGHALRPVCGREVSMHARHRRVVLRVDATGTLGAVLVVAVRAPRHAVEGDREGRTGHLPHQLRGRLQISCPTCFRVKVEARARLLDELETG
mmetsp:Transcript_50035/g.162121  ORF Transcript_50035/g.162121 Transcript_50035/m.162121 type:complete len:306 (-) Transcript_50035:280-1197(-)